MNAALPTFVAPMAPQMSAPPAGSAPAPSSQPGFSQMLSQAQAREAAHATRPAAPERHKAPEKAGKDEHATSQAEAERRAERAEGEGDEARTEQAADAPADPALADWLAALQRPAAPEEALPLGKGRGKGAAADAGGDTGGTGSPSLGKAGAGRGGRDAKAQDVADAARDLKTQGQPSARDVGQSSSFKAALAQAEAAPHDARPVAELPPAHGAAPLGGLAPTHGAARAGEAGAMASVHVPTPATAPEFSHTLGVQISVLAKDGIQQAELHLNPAEMGPISVQIALDGSQAQVNFGADSAATRQILENGLPELAAALRDAGFTLSGGGVHSQGRGREPGDGPADGESAHGGTRAIGATETDVTPARSVARVSAGGVDLYA